MPTTFRAIPQIDPSDLSEGRRLHFYSKGEEIPLVPQGIWQVQRGLVQFNTLHPNGEEVVLGWAESSAFFGLWFTSLQTYQAPALSEVYLSWFSLNEVENSSRLAQAMIPQMRRRMRQTEAMLAIAGQRRVENRLHQLLLLLKEEMGQPVDDGTRINARLTHQTIANAICTTRVTVTRLLSKLQSQGGIVLDSDRHIIVKNSSFANLTEW